MGTHPHYWPNYRHSKSAALSMVVLLLSVVLPVAAVSPTEGNTQSSTLPTLTIRYPHIPVAEIYQEQYSHAMAVLSLICESANQPYILEPVPLKPMPVDRMLKLLDKGQFDFVLRHTEAKFEESLRPIRYPIYRGLIGWRLFFIHQDQKKLFQSISSVAELKTLSAGLGYGWPDIEILSHEGLSYRTALDHKALIALLQDKRIDYFPRGINEIWRERKVFNMTDVVIENSLVLRYPTAFYYFVRKDDDELATFLERGFEKAIANGSYQALFMQYFGDIIQQSNLKNRKILTIENPALSNDTPLERKDLWFSIDELPSLDKQPLPTH